MGALDETAEWLEADGLGGFASGMANGLRTRRYHALLLTATARPRNASSWSTASRPGSRRRPGASRSRRNATRPTSCIPMAGATSPASHGSPGRLGPSPCRMGPCWRTRSWSPGMPAETVLRWRRTGGSGPCRLSVRPLLSGRDYHALQRENDAFRFDAVVRGGNVALAALCGPAGDRGTHQRQLPARPGLVPQLPLRGGAGCAAWTTSRTSPRPACSPSTSHRPKAR